MHIWIKVLCALTALAACDDGAPEVHPLARELSPTTLSPGGVVSVYGQGFGVEGSEDGVWLAGERLEVRYWSDERIDARISPSQPAGSWLIVVRANGAASLPLAVEVRAVEVRSP